jgi:hypothetical protein
MYLNKIASGSGTIPAQPESRAEMYLNKIASGSGTIPAQPESRLEMYLDAIAKGGGGDITVESKTVTANGTVTAPSGKAYSPIIVDVPNSYTAGDNGKVVNNGQLVYQTAHTEVTENGTIDTTLNNSVVVNVQGIGSSPWTKLAEQDFTVNTTSTTATDVGTISIPDIGSIVSAKNVYIWVFVRDKAGQRNGYYYGTDTIRQWSYSGGASLFIKSDGNPGSIEGSYGIYPGPYNNSSTKIPLKAKYYSSFGTFDGTFHVEVWTMDFPTGISSLYA